MHLQHNVSAVDGSSFVRISDGHRPVQADHCVALEEFPLSNLVVDFGRPSSKFQGRPLVDLPEAAAKKNFWPLRQLANLCEMAKTRYGYIVTDQDLVVCCFYTPEAVTGQANGSSAVAKWTVALIPRAVVAVHAGPVGAGAPRFGD